MKIDKLSSIGDIYKGIKSKIVLSCVNDNKTKITLDEAKFFSIDFWDADANYTIKITKNKK